MATVGKQIVALFGSSDMDALRETVKNVKEGNKGLAENQAMAAHLKTLPAERKIELHGAGTFLARLVPVVPRRNRSRPGSPWRW